MSRHIAQHAKIPSCYEGRHTRPDGPGPAALIGTAAKAAPAALLVGATSSAMVFSGPAASPGLAGPAHTTAADLAEVKAAAQRDTVPPRLRTPVSHTLRAPVSRRAGAPDLSTYTVAAGDTLSQISVRFCGTAADYPSLAAASSIANPDLIYPGQDIRLACHHAIAASPEAPASSDNRVAVTGPTSSAQSQTVTTAGMSGFEACVISRESGGNPQAVNPTSDAGGLFQFLPTTWASLGYAGAYPGGAQTAPVSVQEGAFARLYAESGTSPWAPYDFC
jgi:LysM repeat protein